MSRDEVNRIIDKKLFEHYRQPIINLQTEQQAGEELLLRSEYGAPDIIFKQAKDINRLFDLDIASIKNAMGLLPLYKDKQMFINVFPSTIKHPTFLPLMEEMMQSNEIDTNKIVFELNEAEKVRDIDLFSEKINQLRDKGFQIACDDVGKGAMFLTYLMRINVNFVKLDRDFSKNLIHSPKQQDMISAILMFCRLNNIKTVLEGIENEETLELAKKLGVDFGQGYYLGKPEKLTERNLPIFPTTI